MLRNPQFTCESFFLSKELDSHGTKVDVGHVIFLGQSHSMPKSKRLAASSRSSILIPWSRVTSQLLSLGLNAALLSGLALERTALTFEYGIFSVQMPELE